MQLGESTRIDKNWLTTHSVTLGMTGSGKTGLLMLMAEDFIKTKTPLLVLDIKGDLSCLQELDSNAFPIQCYIPEGSEESPPTTEQLLARAGSPSCGVVYLGHLASSEQQVIIAKILNDFSTWMKKQGGSSKLKGAIIIDEIHGLIPPTRKSACKEILMNLIKQARGFGFGINLATQNPGDLDYKALSNIGTWFIGRLNSRRDRTKVIEGLENSLTDTNLKGLEFREFMLHSIYSDSVKFRTNDCGHFQSLTLNHAVSLLDDFGHKYEYKELGLQSRVAERSDLFHDRCIAHAATVGENQIIDIVTASKKKHEQITTKLQRVKARIQTEEARMSERKVGAFTAFLTGVVSLATSKKKFSATNVSRASTALRGATKVSSSTTKLETLEYEAGELRADIVTLKNVTEDKVSRLRTQDIEITKVKLWADLR